MKVGQTVRVFYTGKLDDGTVFDSNVGGQPLEFQAGTGMMIEGFDKAVMNMEVGEKKTVIIPAAHAYGEHDPKKVAQIPRSQFPNAENAPLGVRVMLSAPGGRPIQAVITDVNDEFVTVDFNHELAGKDLTFEIELSEIVD